MLILGDMSIPNFECGAKLIADMKACGVFDDQTIVVNLEGVLHHENPKNTFWKVYNDRSVIELKSICKQAKDKLLHIENKCNSCSEVISG